MHLQHNQNHTKDNVSACQVPRTGVIYVMNEAAAADTAGDPPWANLGQGQPETAHFRRRLNE